MKEYSVVLCFGDENAFDCFVVESSKIKFSGELMDEGCGHLYDGMQLISEIDGEEVNLWAVVIKTFEGERIGNIKLDNVRWKRYDNDYWKDVMKFKSVEDELIRCKKVLNKEGE